MFRPDFPPIFRSPESRVDKISQAEQEELLKFSKDGKDKRGKNEWIRVALLSLLSTTLVGTFFPSKAHADKISIREDVSSLATAAGIQPFTVEALNKLIVPAPNLEELKDPLSSIMPSKMKALAVPDFGYTQDLTSTINIGAGLDPKIGKIKEESTLVGVVTIHFD